MRHSARVTTEKLKSQRHRNRVALDFSEEMGTSVLYFMECALVRDWCGVRENRPKHPGEKERETKNRHKPVRG